MVRQNCLEQFWTAAGWPRSASARRGLAHGWAKQSLADLTPSTHPTEAALCVSGGERWWTNLPGFDKFVWNEFGRPKVGPGVRSA